MAEIAIKIEEAPFGVGIVRTGCRSGAIIVVEVLSGGTAVLGVH